MLGKDLVLSLARNKCLINVQVGSVDSDGDIRVKKPCTIILFAHYYRGGAGGPERGVVYPEPHGPKKGKVKKRTHLRSLGTLQYFSAAAPVFIFPQEPSPGQPIWTTGIEKAKASEPSPCCAYSRPSANALGKNW